MTPAAIDELDESVPRPSYCRMNLPRLPEPDPCEFPDCHCKQIAEASRGSTTDLSTVPDLRSCK